MTIADLVLGIRRCSHGHVVEWDGHELTCQQCEDDIRAAATTGFIGPLTEVDQDRCPACGLDPIDPTLHAPTCRLVVAGLCGVIYIGQICLRPDEYVDDPRFGERGRLVLHEHQYVPLEEVT